MHLHGPMVTSLFSLSWHPDAGEDEFVYPLDLGTILDEQGIAIRAGHHCAKPLMRILEVPATARASFYVYNNAADVDRLIDGLHRAREVFGLA